LQCVDVVQSIGDLSIGISALNYDSRRVCAGDCFFAVVGVQSDGHTYIPQAVERGAKAVVCERLPEDLVDGVCYVQVTDVNAAMADMAAAFYDYPSRELKLVGVTGTNGKTTTTALTGEITRKYYGESFVVGNIGIPYTKVALDTKDDSVIVAEISSFQLETAVEFHPKVSAVLNITPDHLNRHHTMEAYIAAKEDIAKNQTSDDTCVLNYEDEVTRKFGEKLNCQVLYFSSLRKLDKGIYLDEGNIVYRDQAEVVLCHVDELQLLGRHNHENVMAASAMALAYGVPLEVIQKTIRSFKGVAHRIEYVCEKNGVAYRKSCIGKRQCWRCS
jgi:UDP-N-acetylmuramoylalanine--D-glutamate ligase